jgi:hypothetical protein
VRKTRSIRDRNRAGGVRHCEDVPPELALDLNYAIADVVYNWSRGVFLLFCKWAWHMIRDVSGLI